MGEVGEKCRRAAGSLPSALLVKGATAGAPSSVFA